MIIRSPKSPLFEVVGITRYKILSTIEKVSSIKFPFICDLGIGSMHSRIFSLPCR